MPLIGLGSPRSTQSERPDRADVQSGGADGDPEVLQVRHDTAFA